MRYLAVLVAGIFVGVVLAAVMVSFNAEAGGEPCEYLWDVGEVVPGKTLVAYECPNARVEWRVEKPLRRGK